MSVAIVTGSLGLIGSESALHFGAQGLEIAGVDNDMRSRFFGPQGSTASNRRRLKAALGSSYRHFEIDIRDREAIGRLFASYRDRIALVIHTAAQPSHDWAAQDPFTDFDINAAGTLNLLEASRRYCPSAPFIFTSTNKVYGDAPNSLPLVELDTRFEIAPGHRYRDGIAECMPIDASLHSLFGVSKTSADLLVQEYGRYFGLNTACFRGGTLTGPHHAAVPLHGFLAYVMRCAAAGEEYTVFGYNGKQVRDVFHSADLVSAFDCYFRAPRPAAVYNIGGGRHCNCSVLEAIALCEELTGRRLNRTYRPQPRLGDHIWWISGLARFQADYPHWRPRYGLRLIAEEILAAQSETVSP